MNTKKMFKKLTAVATGATMLGATMMGALATDLGDYPEAWVSEGTFDGYFVVGENAAAIDNLAMTDIATSMRIAGDGTTTTTTVDGDAWMVGTSSKSLELANSNVSDGSQVGEDFNDIETFIGEDELAALADGTWDTNEDNHDYQQFLYWDYASGQSSTVRYTEDDEDVVADYLYFKSGQQFARYQMEFTSTAQSDVTDSTGTATTTGTYLDDFENTDLTMLGQDYVVVLARRPASTPEDSVKLTLMAGASTDTLQEGEVGSYNVNGVTYEVEVTYVDDTDAKFTVNGESTDQLSVGETYILADDSEIGVSEILYQGYAGGIHSATFFVGAQKMELRDDDITDESGSYEVVVGSEEVDGTVVVIQGTDDNSTFTISSIDINMTAEDDYFVGAGAKLSDVITAAGEEAEVLFTDNWDITYAGLTSEDTHDLRLKTSSSRRYDLVLFDGNGDEVEIPTAYAENSGASLTFGEDTGSNTKSDNRHFLHVQEGVHIIKNDYFILTAGTSSDGSAKSYLLEYESSDDSAATDKKIKFKNKGNGETLEYTQASSSTSNEVATIKLGGYSFVVNNASSSAVDDFNITVDLNADASISAGSARVPFVDYYGTSWLSNVGVNNSANHTGLGSVNWTMTTPNADDYDNFAPSTLIFEILPASGEAEVRANLYVDGSTSTLISPEGEDETSYGWTSMGAFITFSEPSSDPDEITVNYPEAQRLPQVYVTSGASTSTRTVSGDLTSVNVVDATKLDSEVASVSAQNLIVVGGPCVNTVAAELLGNPADCTEGFTPGVSRVKVFENGDSVAMLVAGYSGEDTRLAGKVIANRWTELSGMEVEIEGTTYSDATISAPSTTDSE